MLRPLRYNNMLAANPEQMFTGTLPVAWSALNQLSALNVSSNNFAGSLPAAYSVRGWACPVCPVRPNPALRSVQDRLYLPSGAESFALPAMLACRP